MWPFTPSGCFYLRTSAESLFMGTDVSSRIWGWLGKSTLDLNLSCSVSEVGYEIQRIPLMKWGPLSFLLMLLPSFCWQWVRLKRNILHWNLFKIAGGALKISSSVSFFQRTHLCLHSQRHFLMGEEVTRSVTSITSQTIGKRVLHTTYHDIHQLTLRTYSTNCMAYLSRSLAWASKTLSGSESIFPCICQ